MAAETIEIWPATGARVKLLKVEGLVPGAALSAREAQTYAAFRIEKRRSEWLAGRLAAKALLTDGGGKAPAEFEINPDKFGRPCCGATLVSISHSNGWAAAAVKPGASFLGLDLEKIEERHPAWYSDYFYPSELQKQDPSEGTRLWAIKEAFLKALGLGLMADPMDIRTAGKVSFSGKALERHREMGSPEFTLETRQEPAGFWTALVAGEAGGTTR
ncbi:MAG: 4'-phosphopantetheinyl transferase superfamily protein [Elusimicrobia bacterium]|nr:4'-phosphopantetheinyl transferase superfamily protein [Elusimicrobiota bacterium]